jgi:biopolymer transport protein ExbD
MMFLSFGIHGAALLAVITATIGLIPVIGRILSILLIFVVALVNGSTTFIDMDNTEQTASAKTRQPKNRTARLLS